MNTKTFSGGGTSSIATTAKKYRKEGAYSPPDEPLVDTSLSNKKFESLLIMVCSQDMPCEGYRLLKGNHVDESRVNVLIQRIYASQIILHREKIASRLFTLHKDAKEEEPESVGISLDSLQSFYDFFVLNINMKYPIITLTPDNNLYASWKAEAGRVFSIHFLDNNDVRFVMFMPNEKHPHQKIRISGSATTDTLKEIAPMAWEWISE